ncbi:hypothetical protein C8J57DRAFT_1515824 [Mycena rebaudengoi]|nr:hypothetical protein C8J57DRAFT_1515824 [Mycena rebaudengoi]
MTARVVSPPLRTLLLITHLAVSWDICAKLRRERGALHLASFYRITEALLTDTMDMYGTMSRARLQETGCTPDLPLTDGWWRRNTKATR